MLLDTLPLAAIDTVFLDVGNTLISIDFDWVAEELGARGMPVTAETLRRAEAAARPSYSHRLFVEGVPAGTDLFRAYLAAMFEGVGDYARLATDGREDLLTQMRRVLRPDGRASVLWRSVMPGVVDALARMQRAGLRLVVVSNSDGTVEQSLVAAGMRGYLANVVDSAVAGVEKPDPRIFQFAVGASGASAHRTVHVGDLYHADVLGARAAGLYPLLLDPYGDWPDVDCAVARDLTEVADALVSARR